MSKLHLVFGGRVKDPQGLDFEDLKAIDFVGVYPDFASEHPDSTTPNEPPS